MLTAVVLLTLALIGIGAQPLNPQDRQDFAVEITGGPQAADEVARKYGYLNRGKVKCYEKSKCMNLLVFNVLNCSMIR